MRCKWKEPAPSLATDTLNLLLLPFISSCSLLKTSTFSHEKARETRFTILALKKIDKIYETTVLRYRTKEKSRKKRYRTTGSPKSERREKGRGEWAVQLLSFLPVESWLHRMEAPNTAQQVDEVEFWNRGGLGSWIHKAEHWMVRMEYTEGRQQTLS